MGGLEPRQLGL